MQGDGTIVEIASKIDMIDGTKMSSLSLINQVNSLLSQLDASKHFPKKDYVLFATACFHFCDRFLKYLNDKETTRDQDNTVVSLINKPTEVPLVEFLLLSLVIDSLKDLTILSNQYPGENDSQRIKQYVLFVMGRFLYLNNEGLPSKEIETRNENCAVALFRKIAINTINTILNLFWNMDETYLLKVLILNLLNSLGIYSKSEIEHLLEETSYKIKVNDNKTPTFTIAAVNDIINKYISFNNSQRPIACIQENWKSAFIYKKKLGFLYCKGFKRTVSHGGLPYSIEAYSPAFQSIRCRNLMNGDKVILLWAYETKRAKDYIPIEDSFFYNRATMKYE